MTLDQQSKRDMDEQCWNPGFIDYLFLEFNTSTAFFAHRYSRSVILGKGHGDDTSTHLLHDRGPASCAGRQYSLAAVDATSA